MSHIPCKEEIVEAQIAHQLWGRIEQSLDIESKDFRNACMVCATINGWIMIAERDGLVRRSIREAIHHEVENRGIGHLLRQVAHSRSQLDMFGGAI